jgi:catechol 2,3-dioxygenase-like lactoylglutathione lyase family enzyme
MIHLFLAALLAQATPSPAPARIAAVEIVVRDLDGERRFYTQALGFRDLGSAPVAGGRVEHLALGSEHYDLLHYDVDGAGIPATAKSTDRDFQHIAIIVSDMAAAWSRVERFGIRKVSAAPQVLPAWNPAVGGIAAVYFRDPEGHPLELLHFPPGKGAPQWQAASPLFLGIDHTAIGVADTAASTRFYELLGLSVRGHSNNYGIEQARLSGIPGAHVQITAVRFDTAPGFEFLHYVTPALAEPRESSPLDDLVATRTVIVEANAGSLCEAMAAIVREPAGCIVRDPDGHLVEIRSR